MVRCKPQILHACPNCGATKAATKKPKCPKCGIKMIPRPQIRGG